LGKELDEKQSKRIEQIQQKTAHLVPATPIQQLATRERIYAAPDGGMYCTTERNADNKFVWKEAKIAAVYEGAIAITSCLPMKSEFLSLRKMSGIICKNS
jgi:hypothetical protein